MRIIINRLKIAAGIMRSGSFGTMVMFTLFFVIIGAILVSGQTSGTPGTAVNQTQNYRIGPGDLIDVVVSQSQQLTRTGVRVDNQGMIQLAMLMTWAPRSRIWPPPKSTSQRKAAWVCFTL